MVLVQVPSCVQVQDVLVYAHSLDAITNLQVACTSTLVQILVQVVHVYSIASHPCLTGWSSTEHYCACRLRSPRVWVCERRESGNILVAFCQKSSCRQFG